MKRTVYHRGFEIEWVEHMNAWRIFREESKGSTIAYEDDLEEAIRRLNEEEPVYCGSEDGYEVEYCNVCNSEIELRWDINRDGFQAYCPVCGNKLMLCDACMHRHGDGCDDCNYTLCGIDQCRFSRPAGWWKERFDE